jgi:hypothetical protein
MKIEKKEKEKKKARQRSKYPALERKLNLNSRRDYIELDYIDGVKDSDGNMVIRPLNEEEKQFFNDFYEETIVTNFLHDDELRRLNKIKNGIIECNQVKNLKAQIKTLDNKKDSYKINKLKHTIKLIKKQNEEKFEDEMEYLNQQIQDRREEVLLYPDPEDHKEFYTQNNARNRCLYNKIKNMGMLDHLDPKKYERYLMGCFNNIDFEDVLINELDHAQFLESNSDADDEGYDS